MWKKTLILLTLLAFTLSFAAPHMEHAEAKVRFSSGKRSFTTTPKKAEDNVMQNNGGSGANTAGTAARSGTGPAGTGTPGGAMTGGGFWKGMAAGGLAGLLLGGMLGSGFFAELVGFLINATALLLLFMLAVHLYHRFIERKRRQEPAPRNRGY
ncbi:MAG: hypothetical protein BAA02_10975 [Paenibacillaceae bacterium ZCTH02-B3]|nr:MAG: hypothetical protein BAA02_10975 [Paenibacillaceae bacterium ZCTH02-B3]